MLIETAHQNCYTLYMKCYERGVEAARKFAVGFAAENGLDADEYYRNGGCGQFPAIVKKFAQCAIPYANHIHIYTAFGENPTRLYDIKGEPLIEWLYDAECPWNDPEPATEDDIELMSYDYHLIKMIANVGREAALEHQDDARAFDKDYFERSLIAADEYIANNTI